MLEAYRNEEPFVVWGPEFELGSETIDSHHRLIVKYINLLHHLLNHEGNNFSVTTVFDSLKVFAEEHFAYEEKIFDQESYEHTAEHKIEHKLFTSQLDDYFHKYQHGDEKVLSYMYDYLKTWLNEHILVHDKKYGEILKGKI